MLNKEYNFIGSLGTTTATGCRPSSNTCPGNGGQDAINGANWCTLGGYPSVSVTYDNAGVTYIDVASHKSIVGVGSSGVIRGIGLRVANGASNVIIQNIHITDLNPQYIWGGDAITLVGTDLIWIDHVKISLIGRQMIVTGYDKAGRVTISNSEFDGQTSWSASCNGNHYWTMLFLGSDDQITLSGNYVHDVSGRAPKIGGADTANVLVHAVNNFFHNNLGHDFDIAEGGQALIEGNSFEGVTTPMLSDTSSNIFDTPTTSSGSSCSSYIGRSCQINGFGNTGAWPSWTTTGFLVDFANAANIVTATSYSGVDSKVVANAGIGKIGN